MNAGLHRSRKSIIVSETGEHSPSGGRLWSLKGLRSKDVRMYHHPTRQKIPKMKE